jgi:hypothetical protein
MHRKNSLKTRFERQAMAPFDASALTLVNATVKILQAPLFLQLLHKFYVLRKLFAYYAFFM